jgi:hypothetical protein
VLSVVLLLFTPVRAASRTIPVVIGALWIWLGVVFQGMYATDIDRMLGIIYAVLLSRGDSC